MRLWIACLAGVLASAIAAHAVFGHAIPVHVDHPQAVVIGWEGEVDRVPVRPHKGAPQELEHPLLLAAVRDFH